jgi:site-specific DNA recombinase
VLLSFAQFEREVTGERIRDKIAASKKKGMWMGGVVPLGYDAVERKLIANKKETRTVQRLFDLYNKLKTVTAVWTEAAKLGLVTKRRRKKDDTETGGIPLQRGHIYKILNNPLYAGWTCHQGARYEGQHEAIVDRATWEQAQVQLAVNSRRREIRNTLTRRGLLVGLLRDKEGRRLTHTHAKKRNRRYRYYAVHAQPGEKTTGLLRVPAEQIETRIRQVVIDWLAAPTKWVAEITQRQPTASELNRVMQACTKYTEALQATDPCVEQSALKTLLIGIVVEDDTLCLTLDTPGLAEACELEGASNNHMTHRVPCRFINRSGQLKLIVRPEDESTGGIDEALIRSVARAHHWFDQLKTGEVRSMREIAEQENLSTSYVIRYFRLAFLAPDIVEAIVEGRQPPGISVRKLTNNKKLPSDWAEQRRLLNFPAP